MRRAPQPSANHSNSRVPQRARLFLAFYVHAVDVSTHASREGRDEACTVYHYATKCFNSRVPRRTRPIKAGTRNLRTWFQLTRPAKDATIYQEFTDMITLSGRVCATVRGGVGLMGLCGAEAREFTGAVRCADIWGFLCELEVRASVLHKRRRPAAASLQRFYMA